MHSAYPKPTFPYYGQPYHTYYPPGYQHQQQQQQQRQPFPTSDPYNSPPWPRENYQTAQYVQGHLDPNTPFIPPSSEPAPHAPRVKRASTTRQKPTYNPEKVHLKSAMKKNGGLRRSETVSAAPPPLERTRTSSSARQRLVPMTRTSGMNSNPSYLPGKSQTVLLSSLPRLCHHRALVCVFSRCKRAPDGQCRLPRYHGRDKGEYNPHVAAWGVYSNSRSPRISHSF